MTRSAGGSTRVAATMGTSLRLAQQKRMARQNETPTKMIAYNEEC